MWQSYKRHWKKKCKNEKRSFNVNTTGVSFDACVARRDGIFLRQKAFHFDECLRAEESFLLSGVNTQGKTKIAPILQCVWIPCLMWCFSISRNKSEEFYFDARKTSKTSALGRRICKVDNQKWLASSIPSTLATLSSSTSSFSFLSPANARQKTENLFRIETTTTESQRIPHENISFLKCLCKWKGKERKTPIERLSQEAQKGPTINMLKHNSSC